MKNRRRNRGEDGNRSSLEGYQEEMYLVSLSLICRLIKILQYFVRKSTRLEFWLTNDKSKHTSTLKREVPLTFMKRTKCEKRTSRVNCPLTTKKEEKFGN